MSSDLIESELSGYPLDGLSFGGAPAADILTTRALAAFPNVILFVHSFLPMNRYMFKRSRRSQGYGLTGMNKQSLASSLYNRKTETNSIATSFGKFHLLVIQAKFHY